MKPEARRLIAEGPLVQVEMSLPLDAPTRLVIANMMVDTGAEVTIMSPRLIAKLGAPVLRDTAVSGVTSEEPMLCPVFRVHLRVPTLGLTFDVDVAALPRTDDACDGLLGRDVLAFLRLTYDGPNGIFEIEAAA